MANAFPSWELTLIFNLLIQVAFGSLTFICLSQIEDSRVDLSEFVSSEDSMLKKC